MVKNLTTLKTYFSTGQKPTQSQFYSLVESLMVGFPGSSVLDGTTAIDPAYTAIRVSSDSGNKTISANPQISDGVNGQFLLLIGNSNTDYITLNNGNGLQLNSSVDLKLYYTVSLYFSSTLGEWIEVARGRDASSLANMGVKRGVESIDSGVDTVSVTFASAYSDTNYAINVALSNIVDSDPSQYVKIITAKATTGFSVKLSGTTDSANYRLEWSTIPT